MQKVRLTYGYKSDLPKELDFYDMEGLFISRVFYFKPYHSVKYFNNCCLSHFDGSGSDLLNLYFAVTYLVRQYCFMNHVTALVFPHCLKIRKQKHVSNTAQALQSYT